MRRTAHAALAASLLALAGCGRSDAVVFLMVVTVSGTLPDVTTLKVDVTAGPAGTGSQIYPQNPGGPIVFPTTLTGQLPGSAAGRLELDVTAWRVTNETPAARGVTTLTVAPGARPTIYVQLECTPSPCMEAPVGDLDGGTGITITPGCGNGVIDQTESCDIAIPAGAPGACPRTCDTGVACAKDTLQGPNTCRAHCEPGMITNRISGDGCCPMGATWATDSDCSPTCGDGVVDPGETCDTGIEAGLPGACPTELDCANQPCVAARLISAGTCSAVCLRNAVTEPVGGDGCCPAGATNNIDADCPAVCGDGIRGAGESCDVGIPSTQAGACPTSCYDGKAGTSDELKGAGCQAVCLNQNITDPISGDGTCAPGATRATDSDCPAACGDGVVEPGETCDPAAPDAAACPTSCPPSPAACLETALTVGAPCTAACTSAAITACGPSDGCCPAGCTAAADPDCSATCGDGKVQTGESCDVAIASGSGVCPRSCDDGDPCTDDRLLSAGTCQAVCVHLPITVPAAGDGCCPPGASFLVDADCHPACGNGIVEPPVETCDSAVQGSCPTACPPAGSCTKVALRGSAATCSAACVSTPIVACVNDDGCCPAGCTAANDSDCPIICGDGVVETGETCDRAIPTGSDGACAATCDDNDPCTVDLARGSVANCTRICVHAKITACLGGDGCCQDGCSVANDSDCLATCNDGRVEAGETCDPPGTCPTTCPDDGDPCTTDHLVGDPTKCTSACRHDPIKECSGSHRDGCCPSKCTAVTDSDC